MDEQKIRQIVRQEMAGANNQARFGMNSIGFHTHDGVNSPQITQDNIIPSVSVSGAITFATATTYTINLNSSFTPSNILAYGNVTGSANQRYFFFGSANLGPSFYLQPGTNTSVNTGQIQYPAIYDNATLKESSPLQSCTYFGAESAGGTLHTLAGEGHIVNIFYGTVHARATVTAFSKSKITIVVTDLDAGWGINANYVIT